MGSCILAPDVALRSWEGTPHAYVRRFVAKPVRLSAEEFEVARLCDGATELDALPVLGASPTLGATPELDASPAPGASPAPDASPALDATPAPGASPALDSLLRRGVVQACEKGAELAPWQRLRKHPCRVMPWMALEVTGRCNYNCLHCFNAADNERLMSELSLEQVCQLLDEAEAAGVQAVLITGGEPLVHPQLFNIVQAIYDHHMFVHELNTNGRLLTREVIGRFRSFGFVPEFKISFDGVGYHDWMRNHAGAEEETLRAIRLCVDEGVRVRVQVNANRRNEESIRPTVELLARMGVGRIRVICTTETPRWAANAPGATLSWEEYLQLALRTAAWYAQSDLAAELNFWHTVTMRPANKTYRLDRVRYNTRTYRDSRPLCPTLNGMVAVGADGQVYPCMQCSGTMNAMGVSLGNVFDEGLLSLMQKGRYCEVAHARVGERLAAGDKCASCSWHTWCAGGCPALGFLFSGGNFWAHDPMACAFFEEGWVERFDEALAGWTCATPLV